MSEYDQHPKFAASDVVYDIRAARVALAAVPRGASVQVAVLAQSLSDVLVAAQLIAKRISAEVEASGYDFAFETDTRLGDTEPRQSTTHATPAA